MNSEIRVLKKYVLPVSIVVVMATLLFSGMAAHAAVVLESGIPGVGEEGRQGAELPGLTTYINYLYIFVLSFVGIAGFISLVIWGTVWVGSVVVDKKARAMEGIKNTLIGIGIALTAFIILYTINPDLTVIKEPVAPKLELAGISQCTKATEAVDCDSGYMCKEIALSVKNEDKAIKKVGRCVITPAFLALPPKGSRCDMSALKDPKIAASACCTVKKESNTSVDECDWVVMGTVGFCKEQTDTKVKCTPF